ncbi:DUF2341 domain-containing protein [Bacillus toyonensis]|uniref:DUF2341 domain-containing protein n=1 Tax=Bacillus toyonensis TaxID=155322 RepID=UPI002E1C9198|nr:DUF2341 domain-containing protein [Bacillus toyonensis]
MFKRFINDENGGLVEYLILLSVMAVASVLIFPSLKTNLVEWNNTMICNVTKAVGGSGECGDGTTNGNNNSNDGFDNKEPVKPEEKPPVTVTPPPEETKHIYKQIVKFADTTRSYSQIKVYLNPSNFDYKAVDNDSSKIKFCYDNSCLKDDDSISTFVETWNPKGESTIWVSVGRYKDQIDMYYGNEIKNKNEEDPREFFTFYEDFESDELDPELWTVPDEVCPNYQDAPYMCHSISLANGQLTLHNAAIGLNKEFDLGNLYEEKSISVRLKLVDQEQPEGILFAPVRIEDAFVDSMDEINYSGILLEPKGDGTLDLGYRSLDTRKGINGFNKSYGRSNYITADNEYNISQNNFNTVEVFGQEVKQSGAKYDYSKVYNSFFNKKYIWLGNILDWGGSLGKEDLIFDKNLEVIYDTLIISSGPDMKNTLQKVEVIK